MRGGGAELRLFALGVLVRARGAKVWLQASLWDFYSADLFDFSTQTCSDILTVQLHVATRQRHRPQVGPETPNMRNFELEPFPAWFLGLCCYSDLVEIKITNSVITFVRFKVKRSVFGLDFHS